MRPWREYADRMYLDPSGPAHLVEWLMPQTRALCGIGDVETEWFGTGSWDEIEHASLLSICPDCLRRAGLQPSAPLGSDPAVAEWRSALISH